MSAACCGPLNPWIGQLGSCTVDNNQCALRLRCCSPVLPAASTSRSPQATLQLPFLGRTFSRDQQDSVRQPGPHARVRQRQHRWRINHDPVEPGFQLIHQGRQLAGLHQFQWILRRSACWQNPESQTFQTVEVDAFGLSREPLAQAGNPAQTEPGRQSRPPQVTFQKQRFLLFSSSQGARKVGRDRALSLLRNGAGNENLFQRTALSKLTQAEPRESETSPRPGFPLSPPRLNECPGGWRLAAPDTAPDRRTKKLPGPD